MNNIKELINIDKNEVLRYLQYKNQDIDENLLNEIEECIELTKKKINPKIVYRKYPISKTESSNDKNEVHVKTTNLTLESDDIYKLLLDCDECILMSATLGLEIEKEIRKLTYTNLTKGIIVDACATTAIEEVCDILQENISKAEQQENKYITNRYSPGYGDLVIEKNVDINNLLNSQKEIGLTVTDSGIMIPRKSVVSIMGVSNKKLNKSKKSCGICNNRHSCKYKREGNGCGIQRIFKK